MPVGYYNQANFGDLYVFDRELLQTRKVYTNAEADALGKPREYVVDARGAADLIVNPSTAPGLAKGSNVYVLGDTFNRVIFEHPQIWGLGPNRNARLCNIHGPVICTHKGGRVKSSGSISGGSRFVTFDGFGDELYLGHWKDRLVDGTKYGFQILGGWNSNYNPFGLHIRGKGTSDLTIEGWNFEKQPFGGVQCKDDWKTDVMGYNMYNMVFRYNRAAQQDSEFMYAGQVQRSNPEAEGVGNGDGVYDPAVDGVWQVHVNPVFENNIMHFTGTEAIQMQRMIGNFKIRNNVIICPDANWLHAFQLNQHSAWQVGVFAGGPEAEISGNISIGGADRHLFYNEYHAYEFPVAKQHDPYYFPNGGYFKNGGQVETKNNLFYGTRKFNFWFKLLDGNQTLHYFKDNYMKGFRSDIDLLYGGTDSKVNYAAYGSNNLGRDRMFLSGNQIEYDNTEEGAYLSRTSEEKKFTDLGGNNFNAEVPEPQFVAGGIVAADWHRYQYMDDVVTKSQAMDKYNKYYLRPGVDINGSEVSINTSESDGEGYPHIFNVGDICMFRDGGVFKRINSAGNTPPVAVTGLFDQGDGPLHTDPVLAQKGYRFPGTKIEQTVPADTVNWEPYTLPLQVKLVPGSFYDQLGMGIQPSPYELGVNPDPAPVVYGCTDPAATNYDPNATHNDGSCTYAPPPAGEKVRLKARVNIQRIL